MYLFIYIKYAKSGNWTYDYLSSRSKDKLKKTIIKKYKYPIKFKKRYGAVVGKFGDVLGWIKKVKEI